MMRWPSIHYVNLQKPIWEPWFAWFPVKVREQWVWLETVERRALLDYGYDYRLPAPDLIAGDADLIDGGK